MGKYYQLFFYLCLNCSLFSLLKMAFVLNGSSKDKGMDVLIKYDCQPMALSEQCSEKVAQLVLQGIYRQFLDYVKVLQVIIYGISRHQLYFKTLYIPGSVEDALGKWCQILPITLKEALLSNVVRQIKVIFSNYI